MDNSNFRALLLAGCAVAVVATATSAAAQPSDAVAFDIPSQPLGSALRQFAEQGQIEILFSSRLAEDRNAPAVRGEMPPADGLALLLAQSGLTYRKAATGSFVIEAAQDPQSGGAAGGGAEVEALIVTAQKREEDIQDVPIAISAFSQEDLTRSQIAGGPDLITQVPNMTFTKTNFSSYSVQLRGIGTQAISATTDPAVAVAFNNTPFIRNRFFEQEFYDLQRVEVLRGPQGTLYGRNATAGVVNIISQKPKFVAEAKLSGDVGNFNSSRFEGMVNIPLVEDAVALRIAGAWTKRDGYATNELTGNPIDGRDLWSTRVTLRVAPTDAIDVNLIWEHFEENDDRLRSGKQLCKKDVVTEVVGASPSPPGVDVTNIPFFTDLPNVGQRAVWATVQAQLSQGCARESLYSPDSFQTPNGASVPYYVPLGGIGLPTNLYDPYVRLFQSQDLRMIESTVDPQYRASADLGELQVSWDISDGLTLSSETAYSRDFVWSTQDFNRFNTAPGAWSTTNGGAAALVARGILDENGVFCDPQVGCSDRLVAVDLSTAKSSQFSQEFRLGSDFDGPFNFSLGANFLRADSEDKYYVFINSLSLIAAAGGANSGDLLPYVAGISDNSQCLDDGFKTSDPNGAYGYGCVYIDPNPIESLNDQGHNYFLSRNPYKLISYAVFGEAYYNVTESLKITGGLRWTVDKKEAPRIPSWTLAGESFGYPVKEVIRLEWREPTGRLAIDWKPDLTFTDETLLYASYAHGYKAGGSNPPPFTFIGPPPESFGGQAASQTRPTTFDAEFIDAYELGAKNTFLDGRVTANLAAFYYDYKGYQVSEIVDRSAFNRNFDATVWGVEIETDWRVLENLRLGFKGGYQKTRIADGERAIDLMDRTAGRDDWLVLRPFPTFASNCILPKFLFAHEGPTSAGQGVPNLYGLGAVGGASIGGCEIAYFGNKDPVTNLPYVANPTIEGDTSTLGFWFPGTYPGWDPTDESQGHNHGEGFFKELGGNELPNAPQFTATITADYTVPLPYEWLATLHTDLHWQAESWWRVFNDHEFGLLDEYFTMNLAAIFTNEERGWNIMAYVKNVTDETAITGAFLNSDDTGLTTNVFLTEPRLYGLRVTKNWTGGPLWGSFGSRHEGPYPFTLELGGQVQRHDAPYDTVRPGFAGVFPEPLDNFDEAQNSDLDWGNGGNVKLTWRPDNSPWSVSAGMRFGKTNGSGPMTHAQADIAPVCGFGGGYAAYCEPKYPNLHIFKTNWSDTQVKDREEHQLIDFTVGRDMGIGGLSRSSISGGLRYAQFKSRTHLQADAIPNWYVPDEWLKYSGLTTYTRLEGALDVEREFTGTGPTISWDAAARLFGDDDVGHVDLDWSLGGGVMFGKQKVSRTGTETATYYGSYGYHEVWYEPILGPVVTPVNESRSQSATVSTFAASLGLSYQVDRFQIGAGYRWERYFDVLDAGDADDKAFDRTIDGPYFKLSVGFGG